ncbi:hypothetical protein [Bacillus sp. USDA818B3_A]|uniref:hypothetical protein n=1 Tax=Bacillus sp. USDA818B3_A TaxID=2698834 RepID=UPI00137067CD|nr:hypothetical protein [Bacillus sp. USDA818B3_A]
MNISDKISQQKLLEIMMTAYMIGQEVENVQMSQILEEIKQKVLLEINTKD